MKKITQFFWNGILITVVSLLIRGVSVSFNVYLSNRLGAVVMGLFTLISTVYGFSITVATSGIGFATTRLVAASLGDQTDPSPKENPMVRETVKKCVLYALCFSLSSAVILFTFSPMIGTHLLQDDRTVLSLRILSVTLPPIALSSVLGGYFTAVRRVYKNAFVQVIGQGIRIYSCIFFIGFFGAKDVESACVSVVLGGALSECISFLIQYVLYRSERRRTVGERPSYAQRKRIEGRILRTALPMAFSAYVRSGLVTVEHMLIPYGLERSGSSRDQSLASYGVLHSMVFPLVLFPSALSGSFAGLLVPEIAQAYAMGEWDRIRRIIQKVYHAVMIFAIGCGGIMLCFSHELGELIYPGTSAGKYILMIAPLVPIMYLDTATDSILKGMGEQVYCMGVNIADAFLSVILVWILLPGCGINGYIMTVYFTELVNATLSIYRLFSVSRARTRWCQWVWKPLLSVILATFFVRKLLSCFRVAIDSVWQLSAHIFLTVVIYLFLLVLLRSIRAQDLSLDAST